MQTEDSSAKRARPFFSTSVLAVLGRISGFLIPLVVAYFYGAGKTTDTFFIALGLIFLPIQVLTQLYESTLVPYLAEHKQNSEKMSQFVSGILILSFLIVGLLSLLLSPILLPLIAHASGLDREHSREVLWMLLEMLPTVFFGIGCSVANAIFFVHKVFWYPALSPIIRSLWIIACIIFLKPFWGIHSVTWGYSSGEILRWGITFIWLARYRLWQFKWNWLPTRAEVFRFTRASFFQAFALSAIFLVALTDQWLAARIGEGAVSLVVYIQRLTLIPVQFFVIGFVNIFNSDWSDAYLQEKPHTFWKKVKRDFAIVFFVVSIFSAMTWCFRQELIHLILGFSSFNESQIASMKDLLGWFILSFPPALTLLLYAQVLLVVRQPIIYLGYALFQLVLNIVLDLIFIKFYGIVGIGISKVITAIFILTGLYFYFKTLMPAAEDKKAAGYEI